MGARWMGGNRLHGGIPSEIEQLTGLQLLFVAFMKG